MKIGFWNLGGATKSREALDELLKVEGPDLICTAEYTGVVGYTFTGYAFTKISPRLALLYKSAAPAPVKHSVHGDLSDFYALFESEGKWIAFCHLKSVLNDGEKERDHHLREMGSDLRSKVSPWENIIVLGDLNADPWDSAVVARRSLNGHQTASEAKVVSMHLKKAYPRLLNMSYQMAKSMSTGSEELWGTYKHKEKKLDGSLRLHVFDQVLVSADLCGATIKVATGTVTAPWHNGLGQTGKNRPWPDHLPILVQL